MKVIVEKLIPWLFTVAAKMKIADSEHLSYLMVFPMVIPKIKGKSSGAARGHINFPSRIKKEDNASDGGYRLSREALSLDFVGNDLINKTLEF